MSLPFGESVKDFFLRFLSKLSDFVFEVGLGFENLLFFLFDQFSSLDEINCLAFELLSNAVDVLVDLIMIGETVSIQNGS